MNKIIRILVCNTTMDLGGAETFIMNLYRFIDRKKIQFDFILNCKYESFYEKEIKALGGKIFKLPVYRVFNHLRFKKNYKKFFKTHPEYKIVYGHNINAASLYLKVAKTLHLHTVSHCHCTTNGKGIGSVIRDFTRRNLYKNSEFCFACSEEAGKWAYRGKVDFKVINNGIDCNKFAFNQELRLKARKEFNLTDNQVLIGHIGRFSYEKNHSFILEIFSEFHKKNPNSHLMLVGSGPLEQQIRDKAKYLGLDKFIIFTGLRTDIPHLMCAMDIFIFPSFYEGLPVTLVEAQCSGLPCYVSDNLTEEVNLTDLFVKLPLTVSATKWAESLQTKPRKSYSGIIAKSNFDISEIAKNLQLFFLRLCSSRKQ